ncbi:MAG: hypothetical protein ABI601_21825 [bacterium]
MTWFGQVRHVMWKDLVEDRRVLLGYAAFVAVVATFSVTTRLGTSNGPLQMLPYLVVLSGMIAVASLVQADSPTRPDAFWASRPFHSSAMFAAKLASAMSIVLLLPLIGQLMVWSANGATLRQVPALLTEPTVELGLWLLIAMVVGALTRDLKSFLVALFGIVGGIVVLVLTLQVWADFDLRLARSFVAPVSMLGGIGLLVWLYRSRDVRARSWLAGFAVTALSLMSLTTRSTGDARLIEAPASVPRMALRLTPTSNAGDWLQHDEILLFAALTPADFAHHLTFTPTSRTVRLRDGSSQRFPVAIQGSRGTHDNGSIRPPFPSEVRWLGDPGMPRLSAYVGLQLSRENARKFRAEATSIEVEGRVDVFQPRIAATIPLVQGSTVARNGRRVRIEKWSNARGEGRLTLAEVAIADVVPVIGDTQGAGSLVDYALYNERRGEVVSLNRGDRHGGQSMQVVPTPSTTYQLLQLDVAAPDEDWLRDAMLVVIEKVPLGGYTVTGQMPVGQGR